MRDDRDYEEVQVIIEERGSAAGAFLLGALVGAAAALLLAPRSGPDTQAEIRRAARRLASSAQGRVDDARDRVTGRVDGVRDRVQARIDAVRGTVETRTAQVRSAFDTGKGAARSARAELRRRVDDAKAAFRSGNGASPDAPPTPAAQVVVTEVSTETDPGDLAR